MNSFYYSLNAFESYHDSVLIHDLVLDKKQSVSIAYLVYAKVSNLTEILDNPFHIPEKFPLFVVIQTIGALGAIWQVEEKKIKQKADNTDNNQSILTTYLWKIVRISCKGSYKLLQRADLLLNVAIGVYYVAQLRFGFKSSSVIGLAGLSFLALKQTKNLSERIERYVKEVAFWGTIVGDVMLPGKNLLMQAVSLTQNLPFAANKILIFFPKLANLPSDLPGKHLFNPLQVDRNQQRQVADFKMKLQALNSGKDLRINPSYVYNAVVEQILSNPDNPSPTEEQRNTLFALIEQKLASRKIAFTREQKEGFEGLKKGLEGILVGTTPKDIEFFKKLTFETLGLILADEIDFEAKIKEFAEIGAECPDAWTRLVSFMHNPKSKEIIWSVHMALAKWREAVLDEVVCSITRGDRFLEGVFGGTNDVHYLDGIHLATRHRIRTYKSEVLRKLYPTTPLERLFSKYFLSDNSGPPLNELFFLPELGPRTGDLYIGVEKKFFRNWEYRLYDEFQKGFFLRHFTKIMGLSDKVSILNSTPQREELQSLPQAVENHVNIIYDALYPQYAQVKGEDGLFRNVLLRPKIYMEVVFNWINNVSPRVNGTDLNTDDIVNFESFINTDLHGAPYLTKEGVRFLLWDLGIIEVGQ